MTTSITWPMPNFPSGGGFSSTVTSTQETTWNGEGFLDELKNGLADITADPSPATIQGFMAYVVNLTSGQVPGITSSDISEVESFLSQNVDMGSLIETASMQGMESAFFLGYNGQTGEAGAQSYITAMENALSGAGGTSTYAEQMQQALQGLDAELPEFSAEHTDTTGSVTGTVGALYWTYGGQTYVWNSTQSVTDTSSDNFMIWTLIQNEGPNGTPNTLFTELSNSFSTMETNWRTLALQNLLQQFPDPSIALSLWMTQAYDSQYQSEESQLGSTADGLSTQTNTYATTLLQDIDNFNSLTTSSTQESGAQSFVSTLLNWNNYVNLNPNSSSIASNISTNTVQAILNTQINAPGSTSNTVTLAAFLQGISAGTSGYTWAALGSSLNALSQPISIPSGSTASSTLENGSQPGYLAMVNAAQSGGTLVSETSQQTATNLQQVADQDNSVLNFGSAMANAQGSGPTALMLAITNNERTTG